MLERTIEQNKKNNIDFFFLSWNTGSFESHFFAAKGDLPVIAT